MKLRLVWLQVSLAVMGVLYAFSDEALKVKNALEAMQASLFYLRERHPQVAPAMSILWKGKTVYSDGPVDLVTASKQFTSESWIIEVSQGLAPLSRSSWGIRRVIY